MRAFTPASPAPAEPALDALMTRHEGLVHAVLRQQWPGPLSYAERLHAGRMGLWQALQRFDPERGSAFSSYAWPAIARHIWRAVQQTTPCAAAPPPRSASPADPDESLLQQEVVHTLHTLVQNLPAPLSRVVVAYYGLAGAPPQSLRQLGRQMGLSPEGVRLRLRAALVWLRHPSHSLPLRQLLDLNTVRHYHRADDLAQAWLRKRGGRRVR